MDQTTPSDLWMQVATRLAGRFAARNPDVHVEVTNGGSGIWLSDRNTKFQIVISEKDGPDGAHWVSRVIGPVSSELPALDGLEQNILAAAGDQAIPSLESWARRTYVELARLWLKRCETELQVQAIRREEAIAKEAAARAADAEILARAAEVRRRRDEEQLAQEREAERRRSERLSRLRSAVERSFEHPEELLTAEDQGLLVPGDMAIARSGAVRDLLLQRRRLDLDDEQATAIAGDEGHLRITARAGSGKTNVVVAHVAALQEVFGAATDSVMVLTFNRKAKDEVLARMKDLEVIEPPVMDFHMLATAVVQPMGQILLDVRDGDDKLSRAVQRLVDDKMHQPDFKRDVVALALALVAADASDLVIRADGTEAVMLRTHDRSLQLRTLAGNVVKSRGERIIANTLFTWSVPYEYERAHGWGGQAYRPDFTIANGAGGGTIIEFFGLVGDKAYDAERARKEEYWRGRPKWNLLSYLPTDLHGGVEAFRARLLEDLGSEGIRLIRKSDEEIIEAATRQTAGSLHRSLGQFITRCRARRVSSAELKRRMATHVALDEGEATFLRVAQPVFEAYEAMLEATGDTDFEGIVWAAGDLIRSGRTRCSYGQPRREVDLAGIHHVIVDEAQDVSPSLLGLLKAIEVASPSARFVLTGDDWQSIYGFTGAEPRIFGDFDSHFPGAHRMQVRTNWRSGSSIVRASNELMNPTAGAVARPDAPDGDAWVCFPDQYRPTRIQQHEFRGDWLSPTLLGVVRRMLADGGTVTLLARYNLVATGSQRRSEPALVRKEALLERVLNWLPAEDRHRVRVSTVHGAKGLQDDGVILLDASARTFPSIHSTWSVDRILGRSLADIVEEERRLFYVALTRAKRSVCVMVDAGNPSPFVTSLMASGALAPVPVEVLQAGVPHNCRLVELGVQTFDRVNEELTKDGFQRDQWASSAHTTVTWWKLIDRGAFDPAALRTAPWMPACLNLSAYSADGASLLDEMAGDLTPGSTA